MKYKVGDEVIDETGDKYVVVCICGGTAELVNGHGTSGSMLKYLKKTGRHFDHAPLMEFLRGESS